MGGAALTAHSWIRHCFPGLCPRPCWESLQHSPGSPSWWGRALLPLPKNPTSTLGLWASFFFIFKHSWAPKRSWKISHGALESPGKVLDFFVSKRVGTLIIINHCERVKLITSIYMFIIRSTYLK